MCISIFRFIFTDQYLLLLEKLILKIFLSQAQWKNNCQVKIEKIIAVQVIHSVTQTHSYIVNKVEKFSIGQAKSKQGSSEITELWNFRCQFIVKFEL